MFRKMRRWKQEIPFEESDEILKTGSYGVLALHGDEDYPYAVPWLTFLKMVSFISIRPQRDIRWMQ